MTTAILSIATLLIGVVAGMAFYHYVIVDYLREGLKKRLRKENEALRFQIEQYNIGRDEMKFTEQE